VLLASSTSVVTTIPRASEPTSTTHTTQRKPQSGPVVEEPPTASATKRVGEREL
jgi:hypothetical protein